MALGIIELRIMALGNLALGILAHWVFWHFGYFGIGYYGIGYIVLTPSFNSLNNGSAAHRIQHLQHNEFSIGIICRELQKYFLNQLES